MTFNQNRWHVAFGGRVGPRMFTLDFIAGPVTDDEIAHVKRTYEGGLNLVKRRQCTQTGRVLEESFPHSDRPHVRSMVAKLVELWLR